MRKFGALIAILICILLCGCSVLDRVSAPELPEFNDASVLVGEVTYVNGRTVQIRVTEADGHFDEDDTIQVTYASLEGSKTVRIRNTITIHYDYVSQVSELAGDPHISVNQLIVE